MDRKGPNNESAPKISLDHEALLDTTPDHVATGVSFIHVGMEDPFTRIRHNFPDSLIIDTYISDQIVHTTFALLPPLLYSGVGPSGP